MSASPVTRHELERLLVADAARRVRSDLSPADARRTSGVLALGGAGTLFAAIFALRLAIHDPAALIANFYTAPVALLAVAYGVRGGVAGAAAATGLVFLWEVVEPVRLDALGYGSRAGVVLLVGTVVGYYSERLRRDIARREEAERELALRADDLAESNRRLEQAVRRLGALAAVARAAGAETDLRRSLEGIVEQAAELVPGVALAVEVRDGEHAVVMASNASWEAEAGAASSLAEVPLVHRGESLGALRARPRAGATLPDPDLLSAIAVSAATAIATARSVAAARVRDALEASEQERRRWAWELHDQTLQGLVGLRVLLSSALRSDNPAELARAAAEALDELQVETSNLKHLIAELRPAALDELGLQPALSELCERVAATSGVDVRRAVALDGARLAPELEATLYRIAQEALTNVGKHAAADSARLAVYQADGMVHVEVSDDGRGFDVDARSTGLGLRGMRERVELAGGSLSVCSGVRGTRVRARLPLTPRLAGLTPEQPAKPGSPRTT